MLTMFPENNRYCKMFAHTRGCVTDYLKSKIAIKAQLSKQLERRMDFATGNRANEFNSPF